MMYKHIKLQNSKITAKSEIGQLQALSDFTWTDPISIIEYHTLRIKPLWKAGHSHLKQHAV